MPSTKLIKETLHEFVKQLHKAEKDNLIQVTVFGSIARGEEHKDSDIDVFVLLDRDEDIYEEKDRVVNIALELSAQKGNGIYIAPFVCCKDFYKEHQSNELLFYNIANDGVVLYDAEG